MPRPRNAHVAVLESGGAGMPAGRAPYNEVQNSLPCAVGSYMLSPDLGRNGFAPRGPFFCARNSASVLNST